MNGNFYFDLRNIHTKDRNVKNIFKYYSVG